MMNDQKLEKLISATLRYGIAISGVLMIAGFALYIIMPVSEAPMLGWNFYSSLFSGGWSRAFAHPQLYLVSGILLLMFTPIVRVLITLISFVLEKDWHYVLISSAVFGVILLSIYLSLAH